MKNTFKKLMEDLRFVIGLFFSLISIILFFIGISFRPTEDIELNLNWIASSYMGIFAFTMILLSTWSYMKSKEKIFYKRAIEPHPRLKKAALSTSLSESSS